MLSVQPTPTPFPIPGAWVNGARAILSQGQDIKQLINDALAVQDGLNMVKNQLAQLEPGESTTKLIMLALACQDKFYTLLTSSRDSASILIAHLEDFTQNIVPLVQDEEVSMSDKIIEVKSAAEMIAATAQQGPAKIQQQFDDLKTTLNTLEQLVQTYLEGVKIYAQTPMQEILAKIEELEDRVATNLAMRSNIIGRAINAFTRRQEGTPTWEDAEVEYIRINVPPLASNGTNTSKFTSFVENSVEICDNIQSFFQYEATAAADSSMLMMKKHELETLRKNVTVKQTEVKNTLRGLSTVKYQFTVLDGKLGNFKDVWNKLLQDVTALNDFLENPNSRITEQEFKRRVGTEGVLYKEIRGALEMYAIKSRRSD